MTKLERLMEVIESHDYTMHPYHEAPRSGGEKILCGYDMETWTSGGVTMIHFIDCRDEGIDANDPDSIIKKLKAISANFDVDEEIMAHRQDKTYCSAFTCRQSVEDFEAYEVKLREMVCAAVKAMDEWKEAS